MVFNPVKVEKDGMKAKRAIWTTRSFEMAIDALKHGKRLVANPFYDGNTKLLKADLTFERTDEEIAEWKRCKNDILYFVERYCKIMTPQGVQKVKLRDYQREYLRHLEENTLSIMLTPRQSGKCFSMLTRLFTRGYIAERLCATTDTCRYNKELRCYEIPFFELYNLYDRSWLWQMEYILWKRLWRIDTRHNGDGMALGATGKLIRWIDSIRMRRCEDVKLIRSFPVDGLEVYTPEGWSDVSSLHLTRPFRQYHIRLDNGMSITCADKHILYKGTDPTFACELRLGDRITTYKGMSIVTGIGWEEGNVSMGDVTVQNKSHTLYTNGILSHNTITSSLFMLHFICFNVDKAALVIANKFKTAKDILKKTKDIYKELPYFLKPGIEKWNEAGIAMDNGCLINAETTTVNSGIGFTYHCVLADEFAHVPASIAEEFYGNLFPTISASNARFMITSTQNGRNLFYRLYTAAVQHLNDYAPFTITWRDVPSWNPDKQQWEARDDDWKKRQVANLGSEESFNKQFGINFDLGSNTLVSQKKLNEAVVNKFVQKSLPGVLLFNSWFWHPDFEPTEQLKLGRFVITVDIGEQLGQDPTVYCIWELRPGQRFNLVGYFSNSTAKRGVTVASLLGLQSIYMNMEYVLLSFERNTYGEIFQEKMLGLEEKFPGWDRSILIKYYNESGTKWQWGIKITPGNKSANCILFKEDYELGNITAESEQFNFQLHNFVDDGSGHYSACYGHDDLIMCAVQLEFVKKTLQYKLLAEDVEANEPVKQKDTIWNPYSGDPGGLDPFGTQGAQASQSSYIISGNNEILLGRRFG